MTTDEAMNIGIPYIDSTLATYLLTMIMINEHSNICADAMLLSARAYQVIRGQLEWIMRGEYNIKES